MTAVPGAPAPRRLLLSSSPRRGAFGPFATLAFISVGLRLMGTLRVRTWQLWGAKTADHRLHHNKDVDPVPDCHIPAIRREFRRILFCKSRAGPPVAGSIDRLNCGQFGANSSEIRGFLSQRCKGPCAHKAPPTARAF